MLFSKSNLFVDKEKADLFYKAGYVVLDLLDVKEINILLKKYNMLADAHNYPDKVHSTSDSSNEFLIQHVNGIIREIFTVKLEPYLQHYKCIAGIFLVKEPGGDGFKDWHQDWTMVDETNYASASVWCPLIDVDQNNGALKVVPQSHLLSIRPRWSPRENFEWEFAKFTHQFDKTGITLMVKAGQAVIYNHALIHASHINKQNMPRVAAVLGIYDECAELVHYYRPNKKTTELECYLIDSSFFFKNAKHLKPEGFILTRKQKIDMKAFSVLSFYYKRLKFIIDV